MVNKLITNKSAVNAKYGSNKDLFWAQVDRLIAFDRSRGIITELVCVDDAAQMLTINAPVVTDKNNCKQNKNTIDGIYNGYNPHYMVILGADDIIPFQILENPTTDKDINVPSDLPYACNSAYSVKISNFTAPSRMVSRLPDVKGTVTDETLVAFVKSVDRIISMYPDDVEEYKSFWNVCTTQRTAAMNDTKAYFSSWGVEFNIFVSPPDGPDWPSNMYTKMTHHHILHGAVKSNILYGESNTKPVKCPNAIEASKVLDTINNGTVVLGRACHEAQLYDPADGAAPGLPIANMYISSGAAAMIGGTKMVYSSPYGMSSTDYLVSFFMEEILKGKAAGEAFLAARQRYLQKYPYMDAIDQKIYGEYVLYGYARSNPIKCIQGERRISMNDMENFKKAAKELDKSTGYSVVEPDCQPPEAVSAYIYDYLSKKGINEKPDIRCYSVSGGEDYLKRMAGENMVTRQYGVSVYQSEFDTRTYLFTEINGEITEVSEYIQG